MPRCSTPTTAARSAAPAWWAAKLQRSYDELATSNLAERSTRYRGHENDAPRRAMRGKLELRVRSESGEGGRGVGIRRHDVRGHDVTPIGILHTGHGHVGHAGMRQQHPLDRLGPHVLAA